MEVCRCSSLTLPSSSITMHVRTQVLTQTLEMDVERLHNFALSSSWSSSTTQSNTSPGQIIKWGNKKNKTKQPPQTHKQTKNPQTKTKTQVFTFRMSCYIKAQVATSWESEMCFNVFFSCYGSFLWKIPCSAWCFSCLIWDGRTVPCVTWETGLSVSTYWWERNSSAAELNGKFLG